MAMYVYVGLCGLCGAIYDYVCLRRAMYGYIGICMAM